MDLWDRGVLLTINYRATGMVKIEPLKSKSAEQVYEATLRTLEEWKPWLHTITSDNGKEFAPMPKASLPQRSKGLSKGVPWTFGKGTDLSKITIQKIKEVEAILNNRPRERFKFKSPKQIMAQYAKGILQRSPWDLWGINQNTNLALIPCQRHPLGEGIPLELLESTNKNTYKQQKFHRYMEFLLIFTLFNRVME